MKTYLWLILQVLILPAATLAQAQQGSFRLGQGSFRIGPVYQRDFPDLDVVIEAIPAAGQNETVFRTSDLVLFEDGKETGSATNLSRFRDSGYGAAVILAVDASGSMKGRPMQAVRDGITAFMSKARDYDKFALVSFADNCVWEAKFTDSRELLKRRLETMQTRGSVTRLWSCVNAALEELSKGDLPDRRRLVVISDGKDEGSNVQLDQLIAHAQKHRLPVDTIGLTRGDQRYLGNMRRLSAETKGLYRQAVDTDSLKPLIAGGIDRLLDSPVARFRAESIPSDGLEHEIRVEWRTGLLADTWRLQVEKRETPVWKKFKPWQIAALAGVLIALVVLLARRKNDRLPPPVDLPIQMPQRPSAEQRVAPPASPTASRKMTAVEPQGAGFSVPAASPNPIASAPAGPAPAPRRKTDFRPLFPAPMSGAPAAYLRAVAGPVNGQRFGIDQVEYWIGAGEKNRLMISDDESLSAYHACVRFEDGALKLYDNKSTNKTYVNRSPIGESAVLLRPGDQIQVGRTVLVVEPA